MLKFCKENNKKFNLKNLNSSATLLVTNILHSRKNCILEK